MTLDLVLVFVGLALLVGGGRALVGGASALARSFGVSELAIGLTVVAFGTSAPELAVNGLAAIQGNPSLAFGNVVGSNIANIALVVGMASLVRPLQVESVIVSREIPMMLLATAATVILGLDRLRGEPERFDLGDGTMLLLLFGVFLYYTTAEVLAGRTTDPLAASAAEQAPGGGLSATGRAAATAAGGLVLLVVGAQVTVQSAVAVAEALDVPRSLIGLTVLAFGTSLPELATSLVATWHGRTNLAVGNIVGSNIFNLLFILGLTAVVRPVPVPDAGLSDLGALAFFSLLFLPLARSSGRRIVRWEGVCLITAYLAYMGWRFAQS